MDEPFHGRPYGPDGLQYAASAWDASFAFAQSPDGAVSERPPGDQAGADLREFVDSYMADHALGCFGNALVLARQQPALAAQPFQSQCLVAPCVLVPSLCLMAR